MNTKECKYVLLVEDDEDLRTQMTNVLEDEGYSVVSSPNGKAALDYLLSCKAGDLPGCIILDLMMPVMTGAEFLRIVTRDHPELAKIPVMVATAKGSPKEELTGIPVHIGRIRKPMEIEDFIDTVMKHCGVPAKKS